MPSIAGDVRAASVLVLTVSRDETVRVTQVPPIGSPQLLLVHRGTASIAWRRGDRSGTARPAPGEFWFIPPRTSLTCEWSNEAGAQEAVLVVLPAGFLEVTATEPGVEPTGCPEPEPLDDRAVAELMSGLAEAVRPETDDGLADLLSRYGFTGPPAAGWSHVDDARIGRAIVYMRENLHRPITLPEIADAASLSHYHFCRVFREITGAPPVRYLSDLRIASAKRQLTDTDLSVTEIAMKCGFSTASNFSNAFHRKVGMSPRVFRRGSPRDVKG